MVFSKVWEDNPCIGATKMDRTGQVVIITGGAGNIGEGAAEMFAEEGATVVLCDIRRKELDMAASGIIAKGGKVLAIETDVRKVPDIERAVARVKELYGRIDILVNVAGGSARQDNAPLHMMSEEVIDRIMELNLKGTLYFCRAVTRTMIDQKGGKIVNIASSVGINGHVHHGNYGPAKAGVILLTKTLAMELGPYQINVNCVSPGLVPRPDDKSTEESLKRRNYLNRICKREDIANAIGFLSSDKAGFITGANIVVDGGWSLGLRGD
jgi:NAD(P)-dependent dehydrogenase (short-subunit alcohol dehydrogenase family)